jgi:hypothetical protein
MKKCTYCGKEYAGDLMNCLVDGEPLLDPNTPPSLEPKVKALGWFEQQFASTSRITIIIGSIFLAGIVFVLGLLGIVFSKSEKARSNAVLATVLGAVFLVAGMVLFSFLNLLKPSI